MIPLKSKIVWSVQALLFMAACLSPDVVSFYAAALALAWFAVFETKGILTAKRGDTLSESVWSLLGAKNRKVTNTALSPLVGGIFVGAAILFVGLVAGMQAQEMYREFRVLAAVSIAAGTLWFLRRHFSWGGNKK